MSGFTVRFLTRPECHLCDDARPLVHRAAARFSLTVDEIDVDGDDALLAKYGLRIPVVLGPDDTVVAEGVIDDQRRLNRAMKGLSGR